MLYAETAAVEFQLLACDAIQRDRLLLLHVTYTMRPTVRAYASVVRLIGPSTSVQGFLPRRIDRDSEISSLLANLLMIRGVLRLLLRWDYGVADFSNGST